MPLWRAPYVFHCTCTLLEGVTGSELLLSMQLFYLVDNIAFSQVNPHRALRTMPGSPEMRPAPDARFAVVYIL